MKKFVLTGLAVSVLLLAGGAALTTAVMATGDEPVAESCCPQKCDPTSPECVKKPISECQGCCPGKCK